MKYFKIFAALLIFIACNNEPKQPETVAVDSTIVIPMSGSGADSRSLSDEPPAKKFTPPLGAQGVAAGYGDMPSGARAVPPAGVVRVVLENKDTQIQTTTKKAVSYVQTDIVTKKYNPGPIPPTPNKAPTANAGIDNSVTLPISVSPLIGSGTDPDGTIASYLWSKVSGPAPFVFGNATAATTSVSTLIEGVYVFRLTVKDNGGLTASDDVKVTVNPKPIPPSTGYLSLPASGPLNLSGQSNVTIENKRFENSPGHAIRIGGGTNITIRNCYFRGTTDDNNGEIIDIENSVNITIENCLFADGVTFVYALSSQTIKVNNNQFVNCRMRPSGHRGQFIQFNGVNGPGCEIMNNQGENFPGESNAEDMVSLYGSSGTASSPIKIMNNTFRGGCPSTSGGGIIAGDNNGGYTIMEGNALMNPGQYGMAIAGGHDIKVLNNKIYSDKTSCSNNPLYVWAQAGAPCSNNLVQGNRVNWTDKTGATNNGWNSGNCSNTTYDPGENKTISKEEMGFPVHLINKITPAELQSIRRKIPMP